MNRRSVLLGLSGVVLAGALPARFAIAQGTPTRIRGNIVSLEGRNLIVTTREGQRMVIMLAENVGVSALRRVELSSVMPGTFIATTAEPDANGNWRALEVRVFPEGMRVGEGHFAWDLTPGSSMTNANVDAAVDGNSGRELTLTARGQTLKVTVPPGTPVVTPIPAEVSDLKPGAQVFLSATRNAAGEWAATRVTVARDGVVPSM
jgi:hypothetical protein